MPRFKNARIKPEKLKDYLLNEDKSPDKAKFIKSLGYNFKNKNRLKNDLLSGLKNNRARISEPNKYGRIHYQVNMTIGVNKQTKVVTGWYLNKGSKTPQLATVRPYKGKKDDF
ncbi:MAG: hypothetical protein MJ060_04185 [Clostridia bacterium]|nr:hypothetical protein [Clostridia bacterium]